MDYNHNCRRIESLGSLSTGRSTFFTNRYKPNSFVIYKYIVYNLNKHTLPISKNKSVSCASMLRQEGCEKPISVLETQNDLDVHVNNI